MNRTLPLQLIRFSLFLLSGAIGFGVLAAFVFIDTCTLGNIFPFRNLRPLHVSSAVFWILTAASGCVMYYTRQPGSESLKARWPARLYLLVWMGAIIAILTCFLFSRFGGREYWEYPPILAIPVLVAWILFAMVVIGSIKKEKGKWPVYFWMWTTGIVFFIFTYLEANLWVIPWFRDNIIRDITVQWKANGSLVGSWNMMVYGSGIYLMSQISGDNKTAFSRQSFFFYFLGIVNLLFNWGHHVYAVPAAPWIRQVSYIISMTEWVIFLNIIRNWRKTLSEARKHKHLAAYKLMLASEVWVFANLLLALFMSIPAINHYTHGTHITVAHAMGTTIGINTMILLACIYDIYTGFHPWTSREAKWISAGFWVSNLSLLLFWLSLIGAGVVKAWYLAHSNLGFYFAMSKVMPWLDSFAFAGIGVMAGLAILAVMILKVKVVES